jgi:beta-galactosidase GanA
VSRIESWTEIHLLSAKFKEPSLLTLNFGGENHEKGFPENAGKKPLRVFYMPSEAS